MRRISSRFTYLHKRIFPVIWFAGFLLFVGVFIYSTPRRTDAFWDYAFLVIPIVFMIIGYFLMKKLLLDLVDEVWDDGDALLIRNRGEEERIALADVKNVGYSQWANPPRVTLSLRRPTAFGDQVSFSTPVRLLPFATNPIINDLIERVDRAREQSHHRR